MTTEPATNPPSQMKQTKMNCKTYFQYCKHFNWEKKTYDGMTVDELDAYIQSRFDGTCKDADKLVTGRPFLEMYRTTLARSKSPDEIGYYLMRCLKHIGICQDFVQLPTVPECVLKWLARHYNYDGEVCFWLPDNPQVGGKFREMLARRSDGIRSALAESKLTQVPLLMYLAENHSNDEFVRRALINNPNTPDKIIKRMKRMEANKSK